MLAENQPRRRRRVARSVGAAAVLLSVAGAMVAQPASADPLADKRQQAQQIAARVHELNESVEKYAELANGARYELQQVNEKIVEAEARIGAAQAEQALHRSELAGYAVEAYVRGGDLTVDSFDLSQDTAAAQSAAAYLAAAARDRQGAIDRVKAAEEDYQAGMAELDAARTAAEAKQAEVKSQQTAAQAAVDEQERILSQVQGELDALVREAEAAEAARQQAAAEANRAANARQPAATTRPPASGGGGRGSSGGGGGGGATSPAVRGGVEGVLAEARAQLGVRYVWGGSTPSTGFDCSGFTAWVWKAGGVSLPHYTVAQYNQTRKISMNDLQPGDLVFYGGDLSHVGLYVGGGQIIHAPNSRSVVRYDSVYYWNTSTRASRV